MSKKEVERKEAWMRLPTFIISGPIILIWRYLTYLLIAFNFFYAILTGKRWKELATFSEVCNTQTYIFFRYMTFVTNDRPFPFGQLAKSLDKFQ